MDALIIKKGMDFEAYIRWEDNAGDLNTGVSAKAQIRQFTGSSEALAEFNTEGDAEGLIEFGSWPLELDSGSTMTFNVKLSMPASETANLNWNNPAVIDAQAVDSLGKTWPLLTEEDLDPVEILLKDSATEADDA